MSSKPPTADQPPGAPQAPTADQPPGAPQAPTADQPPGAPQAPTADHPPGAPQAPTADHPPGAPQAPTADQPAALTEALSRLGDRWKLAIVAALLDGPCRFGELSQAVDGIAPNTLSQRLRRLEQDGLVLAVPYCERPVRFLYELTASGHDLTGVLRLLADWGVRHGGGEPLRHDSCGTPLEARWYCPTCHEPADDDRPAGRDRIFYA